MNILPNIRMKDYLIPWGGVLLPASKLAPHFLVIGTTNSGKTLTIRMVLRSALLHNGMLTARSIIYDGKREYYQMLKGMGVPDEHIYIANPADARCCAWDIAGDIQNIDDARNIVDLLVPEDKHHRQNPFFPNALRSLVTATMMYFHEISPGRWRLADILNALRTPDVLRQVLDQTQSGRETRARYFTDAKEAFGGIISTIDASFLSVYETVARIWARSERSIRISDWINGHKVILLGYDSNRLAADRINQAIFQRAAQMMTSLPENVAATIGESWIVLDEIRFLGALPMLPPLVSFGRTKGVRAIMAPQDIDGVYSVYGEHEANEMLGMCGNISVLRLDSTRTREWASKLFGDHEKWERDYGSSSSHSTNVNYGGSGGSSGESWSNTRNTNRKIVKRELVLASEFMDLPQTDPCNGMHGFLATPQVGIWRATVPPAFLDAHLPKNDLTMPAFVPRPQTALDPVNWDAVEMARFLGATPNVTPTLPSPTTIVPSLPVPIQQPSPIPPPLPAPLVAPDPAEPTKAIPPIARKPRGTLPMW